MSMFRRSFSPIRIFTVCATIGIAVLIYMIGHPKVTIEPVTSPMPGAAFGTIFDLRNRSVAVLNDVTSVYCINSFEGPGSGSLTAASAPRFGVPSATMSLANLSRGDVAVVPVDNVLSGPPGSAVDMVFVVRFEPDWWLRLLERRYRFLGSENPDGTWTWKEMPLGSPCG